MTTVPAELDLSHLHVDVRDLARSERFYSDVLGLPVDRRESSLIVRKPGFLMVLNSGEPSVAGTFHFGFRVATPGDVDAWFARFAVAGVPIVKAPNAANGVYVGRIADPDGYPIEIYCDL
jgi:catechol 2,3-dioxygenase-like lactoylglutathione lyase family enzyme